MAVNSQEELVALIGKLRQHQSSRRKLLSVLANAIEVERQLMDQLSEKFADEQALRAEPRGPRGVGVTKRILEYLTEGPKLPEEISDELNRQQCTSRTARSLRQTFYLLKKSGQVIETKYGQYALWPDGGLHRCRKKLRCR